MTTDEETDYTALRADMLALAEEMDEELARVRGILAKETFGAGEWICRTAEADTLRIWSSRLRRRVLDAER